MKLLHTAFVLAAISAVAYTNDKNPLPDEEVVNSPSYLTDDFWEEDSAVVELPDEPVQGSFAQTHANLEVEDSSKLVRANVCPEGNVCLYETVMVSNMDQSNDAYKTQNDDGAVKPGKYVFTMEVTPDKQGEFNVWNVKGKTFMNQAESYENQDEEREGDPAGNTIITEEKRDQLFKLCSARIVQDPKSGKVHTLLADMSFATQNDITPLAARIDALSDGLVWADNLVETNKLGCPSWGMKVMLNTIKDMAPAVGHQEGKKMFSVRERVGDDHRKVDYLIEKNGRHTSIRTDIHHHYFSEPIVYLDTDSTGSGKELLGTKSQGQVTHSRPSPTPPNGEGKVNARGTQANYYGEEPKMKNTVTNHGVIGAGGSGEVDAPPMGAAAKMMLAAKDQQVATPNPTIAQTAEPTEKPTEKATEKPTQKATEKPTQKATEKPTEKATEKPSEKGDSSEEAAKERGSEQPSDISDQPSNMKGNSRLNSEMTVRLLRASPKKNTNATMVDMPLKEFIESEASKGYTQTALEDAHIIYQPQTHFDRMTAAEREEAFTRLNELNEQELVWPAFRRNLGVHMMKHRETRERMHSQLHLIEDHQWTAALLHGVGQHLEDVHAVDTLLDIAADENMRHFHRDQALLALISRNCKSAHQLQAIQALARRFHHGGVHHPTALHVQHILMNHHLQCNKMGVSQIEAYAKSSEQALLQAHAAQDWETADIYLVALRNSRLNRHAALVEQLLQDSQSMPEQLVQQARKTISTLRSESEDLVQSTVAKDRLFKWGREWKVPADPADENAQKPQFQAIFSLNAGADKDSKNAVLSASATARAKVYTSQYSVVEATWSKSTKGARDDKDNNRLVIKILDKYEIYNSNPKSDSEREEDERHASPTPSPPKPETGHIGRCQTEMSKTGFLLRKYFEFTLFHASIPFFVGPFPCEIRIRAAGTLGFQMGAGALANEGKALCQNTEASLAIGDPADVKPDFMKTAQEMREQCSNKDNKCVCAKADCGGGVMAYVMPYVTADLTATAAVTIKIAEVSLNINVQLVNVKLPITLEGFIGGNKDAFCGSAQLRVKGGKGSITAEATALKMGKKSWTILEWGGMVWNYPGTKQYIGKCSPAVGLVEPDPPSQPKLSDYQCSVTIHSKPNFQDHTVDGVTRSFTAVSDVQSGRTIALPKELRDWSQSIKLQGNCEKVMVGDEDWYDGHPMWLYDSEPDLPYGTEADVANVNIFAMAPHPGKPQPKNEWNSKCIFAWYEKRNFRGEEKERVVPENNCNIQRFTLKGSSSHIASFRLSPPCKGVKLFDDDENQIGYDVNDKYYDRSVADLPSDLKKDIRVIDIYPCPHHDYSLKTHATESLKRSD